MSSLTSKHQTSRSKGMMEVVRQDQEPSIGVKSSDRSMPRWLRDLKMGRNDSSLNHIDSPVTERSQRPVADHVINLKPEWFEQLEQKRRHSDQEVKPVVDIDMIFNGDEKEEKVERKKISLIRSDPILDIERLKLSMKPLLESRRSSTTAPFIIPELPCGRELVIEMLENWGDEETIGLNGIEIFESVQGKVTAFESVTMKWKSETTNCRSETIKWKSETMKWKSEMKSEKSLEQKLFSGPFRTHDDHHIWSCDWDPGVPLQIHITFHSSIRLALLRFWNYNKSRIHSYRGVKNVQVRLDNQIVFKGEIAKASGELRCQPEKLGDTIVFTTDEVILDRMAETDSSYHQLLTDLSR